ncbi:hypothetical protein J4234_01940 [Candidatus Woesearchaeota archaeon]|nr:hypothetical protein [Candidatus Woesearchaeota archaeon]
MKIKTAILAVLVLSVFLVGCTSSGQSGYATYNQPQQQQQGQYVGGGCGVAPSADYEDTPVDDLNSKDSVL